MTRWRIALALLVALGVALLVHQLDTNAGLRREIAQRRDEQHALAKLRRENEELRRLQAEVDELRSDEAELVLLQTETTHLQQLRAKTITAERAGASVSARRLPASPALEPKSKVVLKLPEADVRTVLSAYEKLARQRVVSDPGVRDAVAKITIKADSYSHDEALALLRAALREQAGIALEAQADGTVRASFVRRSP